jgi:putative NADH-flavin reductase
VKDEIMKVVIFGSTGATGLELVQQALDRGHHVVAFARNPADIPVTHERLEVAKGDVLEHAALQQAVRGADAAISVLGVRMGQASSTARSVGTRNIVQALAATGVKRFVSVSAVGAGAHLQSMPWIARLMLPLLVGKWRLDEAGLQEEAIAKSPLDWVILRAPRLVDGQGTGRYRMAANLVSDFGDKLPRADLAKALLDQLTANEFVRTTPTVKGC